MSDPTASNIPLVALAEEKSVLTEATVSDLLHAASQETTEEDRHPWKCGSNPERPLLRLWDRSSGSQHEHTNPMLSRSRRGRLDTYENRKDFLTTHADHGKMTPTPFISFTTSAETVQDLADYRTVREGIQRLTVINPNVRTAKHLPIINMGNEMRYYRVSNPYGRSHQYYEDHHLCLWEVTSPEIVGNWLWNDLVSNDDWYEEIIMPAFHRHNERFFTSQANMGAWELADRSNALVSTSLTVERSPEAPLG